MDYWKRAIYVAALGGGWHAGLGQRGAPATTVTAMANRLYFERAAVTPMVVIIRALSTISAVAPVCRHQKIGADRATNMRRRPIQRLGVWVRAFKALAAPSTANRADAANVAKPGLAS